MLILNSKINGKNEKQTIEVTVFDQVKKELKVINSPIIGKHPITKQQKIIQAFSMTRPMNKPAALDLHNKIQDYEQLETELFTEKNHHIISFGNTQELNKLPSYFVIGNPNNVAPAKRISGISATKWINFLTGVPFGTLQQTDDGQYYIGKQISLREFKSLKTCSFDSEWMFWEKEIYLEDIRNYSEDIRKFIRTFPEFEDSELSKKSKPGLVKIVQDIVNLKISEIINDEPEKIKLREDPFFDEKPMSFQIGERENNKFKVTYIEHLVGQNKNEIINLDNKEIELKSVIGTDANDIMNILTNTFNEEKYIILLTQNGMKYDLLKSRKYTEEQKKKRKNNVEFNIQGKNPIIKNSTGFYPTVITPSIIHIDIAAYSQNYFPFSKSNKFEDVMSLVLGRKIKKTQGYDDLSRMSIEQLIGSEEAGRELKEYGSLDVILINEVEEYFKELVFLKSNLFHFSAEEICTVSKKNLGKKEFEIKMALYKNRTLYWNIEDNNDYQDLKSFKTFTELLDSKVKKKLKNKITKEITKVKMYYLSPFTFAYQKFLKKNSQVEAIYDYIRDLKSEDYNEHKARLAEVDLMNTIETGYLMPYLLEDKKQGFTNSKRRPGLNNSINKFSELILNHKIINYSNNFFCFPIEETETIEFQERIKDLGIEVVAGDLMNVSKGKFVINDGINNYKQGIDIRAINGFKTIYQREITNKVFNLVFEQGIEDTITYLNQFFKDLKNKNLDRNKLIYFKKEVSKDYFDYSAPAQREHRIQAYIELSLEKGDKFAYAELVDGWHTLDEFLNMPDEVIFENENLEFIRNDYIKKLKPIIEPLLYSANIKVNDGIKLLVNGDLNEIPKVKQIDLFD